MNMNWIWNDKRTTRLIKKAYLKIVDWLLMICLWHDDDRMIETVPDKQEMWTKIKWNSWMDSTLDYQSTHTTESVVFPQSLSRDHSTQLLLVQVLVIPWYSYKMNGWWLLNK